MVNRKPEGSLELDDIVPIQDFSNETLLALAERLEASRTFQEYIAREVELDEIWRRVETAIKEGPEEGRTKASTDALRELFAVVMEAHDLAGYGKPLDAARQLRAAMSIYPRTAS